MQDRRAYQIKQTKLKTGLHIITAIVLLAGLGSAVLIYLTAENESEENYGYELLAPGNSKRYIHDLELYGGKANVLADKLTNWFTGLWHGRSLAFTVAFITIFISCWLFVVARQLPSDLKSVPRDEGNQGRTD